MNQETELASELQLGNLLAIVARRVWIVAAVFVIATVSTAIYVFTTKPVYSATALVLIEKEEKGKAFNEGSLTESSADDYYQTQYKLIKSRSLLKKAYEALGLKNTEDFADPAGIEKLVEAVRVTPVLRSRLVNISAESHDRELVARLANEVADLYVSQNLDSKLFISKDILTALQVKTGGNPAAWNSIPAVVNNPLIQQLKASYAGLEARSGDLSSRYTEEHPERRRLKSEMEALKARIDGETRRVVEGMKSELSGQMLGNNIRVVDPAEVPRSPSRPRKLRALLLASFFGLLGGVGLALGIDSLDQSIHSQEDIERALAIPYLGAVPRSATFEGSSPSDFAQLLEGPQSVTGEALKNVRTMLGFAGASHELKSMLVTSTVQGEGKTFMSITLALVFAQLGEKVLLIEGDLRRPNLHKRFGLSKAGGLSTFLAHGNTTDELAGLIQDTDLPGLKVLVCGPIPPNPAELLSTPRLPALLKWVRGRYDRVIIDGTPVFPVTDTLLWGHDLDAVVFVVQFGGVHAKVAARALQRLKEGGLRITGAVVNQVTSRMGAYADYYHQYKYYAAGTEKA